MTIEQLINNELIDIYEKHWEFLYKDYVVIDRKYHHRTELRNIDDIEIIKEELLNKLGYTTIFFFINELFGLQDYPGAYKTVDKAFLILYHMISGKSIAKMNDYINYSVFYDIYKKFWIASYTELNKKVDKYLNNMFSSIMLRLLCAQKYNPKEFKHVTLLIDGHDSKINYENVNVSKRKLFSYKLKKAGVRTQICTDINGMIIYISNSKFCRDNTDGEMFLKMNLQNNIEEVDCMGFDGGYYYSIDKFIEQNKTNKKFKRENFIYPYRKIKKEKLSDNKLDFNEKFGSFRSTIETQFAEVGNVFKKFSNSNATTKTANIKYYNLQFKLCILLRNISHYSKKFEIEVLEHHTRWYHDKFDLIYNENNNRNYEIDIEYVENYDELESLQKEFMGINLVDCEMLEDEEL